MSALDDKARELGALMDVADLRQQLAAVTARAEAAEARLLALQVDRSKAVKLRDETDNAHYH